MRGDCGSTSVEICIQGEMAVFGDCEQSFLSYVAFPYIISIIVLKTKEILRIV
jgi:hypothetical protein